MPKYYGNLAFSLALPALSTLRDAPECRQHPYAAFQREGLPPRRRPRQNRRKRADRVGGVKRYPIPRRNADLPRYRDPDNGSKSALVARIGVTGIPATGEKSPWLLSWIFR